MTTTIPMWFIRYTPDRSGAGPAEIFKDFEGYLQADAVFGLRRDCTPRERSSRSGA